MIYWKFKDWIYINLENPLKTYNKVKKIFKPLTLYFKFGKNVYPECWYAHPFPIQIVINDVSWKDKWHTPRYEGYPFIWIHLFKFNLLWYWSLPRHQFIEEDAYWEQLLWYVYYYDTYSQGLLDKPDINKAKESWPWENYETKESTWNDIYLIK